jgi:hypothetical protein
VVLVELANTPVAMQSAFYCPAGAIVVKARMYLPLGPEDAATMLDCTCEMHIGVLSGTFERSFGRLLLSEEATANFLVWIQIVR